MSGPDRNTTDETDEAMRERIAAELAALGEDGLGEGPDDDDALAFALGDTPDLDIATVQTLAGWADADPDVDDELSELAQARVWRTIELRTKSAEVAEAPTTAPRSGRPLLLGAVVAMVAVAAGVLLVPVLTPSKPAPTEPVAKAPVAAPAVTAEELDVLSTQARAGLAALDRLSGEPQGTARVEAMADAYARRLEAEG